MLVFLLWVVGNFELDRTSHLLYKFITVVFSILLYHMYGRRFIFVLNVVSLKDGVHHDTRSPEETHLFSQSRDPVSNIRRLQGVHEENDEDAVDQVARRQ